MISWIQKTFQQHFRVIFAVLLGVTIISFIFTIGAAPGIGQADRKSMARPFFDLNLATAEDYRQLRGDAELSIFVQAGFMGVDDARLQSYAYARYACLALADQLHIPAPTQTEITEYIRTMSRFAGENGQFDARKYSEFRDSLKRNSRVSEVEISRVLADNIRAERVQKLLSGPGYVLPSEVKREIAMADSTWTLNVASLDFASFNPPVNPAQADLEKFFADNAFRYEIPPQVDVSYVEFPATAYVAKVNVTEPEVRAFYDANPARFPKPAAADQKNPPAANPAADYAAVRPQVEAALKLERAQRLAAKDASDFAVALYERKLPYGSPELAAFLSQRGLTMKDSAPFSAESVPEPFSSNPQIAEEVFRLNKDRYFSDALAASTGSVVLFWENTIPSRQPALAEVRARVSSDYVEEEKRRRFIESGRAIRTQVAARVQTGESFEKAVTAAASAQGIKAEVKTHAAFTLRQRPQDLDYAALSTLANLNKGEVSEMVRAQGNKGLLVYAADKKVPDISASNPQFQSTRAQLAEFSAARAGNEYLQQIVQAELSKGSPATP